MMNPLNWGTIQPLGWIAEIMQQDLDGMIGNLDDNVPALIKDDDIYGANRLSRTVKRKNVGAVAQDADWEVQYLWWNSETQSNWLDGLLKLAHMTGHKPSLDKAAFYLNRARMAQDEDGYWGIYDKDLRYSFDTENGELWAQASLFRAVLAEYEFTNDKTWLQAVIKAMDVTMAAYTRAGRLPFKNSSCYAGLCHGLMLTDTCYQLYRHTGEQKYLAYAAFLYDDYSSHVVSEEDIQKENVSSYTYRLKGHGVHTYEHLRSLIVANMGARGAYQPLLEAYLHKLTYCLTPAGGPIGDEWVAQRAANAENAGYEYCSIHELMDAYWLLLQTTGSWQWANRMEWLFYNAALGARHPQHSQIAYCKTDNSYAMLGGSSEMPNAGKTGYDLRYKYSAVHQDVAVCCVPNAGRLFPCFVQSAYMQKNNGLAVAQFVSSRASATINGVAVILQQTSSFPNVLESCIHITAGEAVEFPVYIRRPAWASGMQVEAENAIVEYATEECVVKGIWLDGTIHVRFTAVPQTGVDLDGRFFYSYGPQVYALPLPAQEITVPRYPAGEPDRLYQPLSHASYAASNKAAPVYNQQTAMLEVELVDTETGEKCLTELLPLRSTILRQVSFALKK